MIFVFRIGGRIEFAVAKAKRFSSLESKRGTSFAGVPRENSFRLFAYFNLLWTDLASARCFLIISAVLAAHAFRSGSLPFLASS